MLLASSHHVIPENTVKGLPISQLIGNSNATLTANYTYVPPTETIQTYHHLYSDVLGTVITILVVIVLMLGLSYIVFRQGENDLLSPRDSISSDTSGMEKYAYRYNGLRRRLRDIYLSLRQQAEDVVAKPLRSFTFRETLATLNMYKARLVSIYEQAMYSANMPTEDEILCIEEEVRRVKQKWAKKQ